MPSRPRLARVVPAYHRFLGRVPDAGGLRRGAAGRRAPGLGGHRLQPPGPQPPPGGRRRGRPARRRGARATSTPSWPCPAWAPTRPGRCWPSPSSATSAWWTPTPAGCLPGRWPAGRWCRPRPSAWSTPWSPRGAGGRSTRRCSTSGRRSARPGARLRGPARSGRRCRWARAGRPVPDPARGSAGVSTPPGRFAGSDRQGRGRLVAALRRGRLDAAGGAGPPGWAGQPARARPRGRRPGGRGPGRPGPGRDARACRRGRRWAAGGQVAGPAGRVPVSRAG